jgi:putative resolvase
MTAWRHYNAGTLPPELQPKKIGNIIYVLANPDAPSGRMVGYARVSSAEQKPHLENQANRLWAYAGQNHIPLDDVVSEIASGLNDRRPKLLKLLKDPTVHTVIIEHRERLARFGVGMVEAMLQARGGSLIVIDGAEVSDDLVRDMTEILTCFCARLYGKRSAADKARRAMEAASG